MNPAPIKCRDARLANSLTGTAKREITREVSRHIIIVISKAERALERLRPILVMRKKSPQKNDVPIANIAAMCRSHIPLDDGWIQ